MGIRTDDIEITNNACPACFDADETPETLIAVVGGIELSTAGKAVGGLSPPNGIFVMDHVEACSWFRDISGLRVNHTAQAEVGSSFQILHLGLMKPFFGAFGQANCNRFFINSFADVPHVLGIGGTCHILTVGDYGVPNLQETMELLNIVPDAKTFAEPNTMPGDKVMHRFASHKEVMNIKIKQEY